MHWEGGVAQSPVGKPGRRKRWKMKLILMIALALVPLVAKDNEPVKRLNGAAAVFTEVMGTPDKGIPQELLENAHCIVIVPGLKTAALDRKSTRLNSSHVSES